MKTTLLCILDGYGLNPKPKGNSVAQAKKPTLDALMATCPHSTLTTFGEAVGLPAGQMGNSEVGHLNIGAGRVIEQWLLRISRGLAGPFLQKSTEYQSFIANTKSSRALHLIGLYSSGGVHSHLEHLHLLIERLSSDSAAEIVLHLISDGRDVSPTAFQSDLADLQNFLVKFPKCTIGSISGRFFAMDRDTRWDRVQSAYETIVSAKGEPKSRPVEAVQASYASGTTDEQMQPFVVNPRPMSVGDGVVFWNFRADRMREIVAAICRPDFQGFIRAGVCPAPERVLCFTEYDQSFGLPFLFPQLDITNHLGEVVSKQGLEQLRVAETEKYPHVTYFLNGGVETAYKGEERKLIPSPRDVKTYDLKPEMSAFGVTEAVVEGIRSQRFGLIVVNLANCDMVGHTGVLEAGIKAVETVDLCLSQMLAALRSVGGQALIIADHGNAEQMINYEDGTPHTAHTTYPVPVILVDYAAPVSLRRDGALCDVAPTLLKMMSIPQPSEMGGNPLF